jgi:hypothetical protein
MLFYFSQISFYNQGMIMVDFSIFKFSERKTYNY